LQLIWGNRCNSEPYQEWLFLPLNQRAVGSTPTRPTKINNLPLQLPCPLVQL
jgi:hypothetical protein